MDALRAEVRARYRRGVRGSGILGLASAINRAIGKWIGLDVREAGQKGEQPPARSSVYLRFWGDADATWGDGGLWGATMPVAEAEWQKAIKRALGTNPDRPREIIRVRGIRLRPDGPHEFVTPSVIREIIRPHRTRSRRKRTS